MRRIFLLLALAGAMLLGCTGVVLAQHQGSHARQAARHLAPPGQYEQVCPSPAKRGQATCLSKVRTDANPDGASPTVSNPSGYYPTDLQAAYNLPSGTAGSGMTVAVVGAYDDPNAESDLNTYRSYFGLPACTTTNGCFRKIDQRGGTSYSSPDQGWAEEISLDLDMVSAICPNCKILLVEADSANINDLGAGVDEAVRLGANAVSNSYSTTELNSETSLDSHYRHPGVAITAASGDSGYGVGYPATSQFVTAVGGTSLSRDSSVRGWTETAWSGAGSGCSAYISKPSWQTDGGCGRRTVADVAADADPNTGVAIYDGYGLNGKSGWFQVGGTSVSAPIIASVYALAGNTSSINDGSYPYGHTSALYDITSGSNGSCGASATSAKPSKHHSKHQGSRHSTKPDKKNHHKKRHHNSSSSGSSPQGASQYLCTSVPGYDGPTGNGTPNGTGAF